MNKTDFAKELAMKTNLSNVKAMEIANAMLEILSKNLKEKKKIRM